MAKTAAELKEEGNTLFKAGKLTEASKCYAEAERVDPTDPVYSSNLSAALYEAADYAGTVDAVLRAWRKLREKSDAKPDLILRLSSRLAKALSLGVRARTISRDTLGTREADIRTLRDAAVRSVKDGAKSPAGEELLLVWKEWDATEIDVEAFAEKSDEASAALSRMSLFSRPLDDVKEYYSIGNDPIIDLLDGWGSRTDPDPLDLNKLPKNCLSEVAFLFGGVGDGRHAFGTLSGLHDAYKALPKAKRVLLHAHLTMLDIHDATIARDLCMLILLDQLITTTDAATRIEIKATLMYMFLAAVMPSYCYDRLLGVMRDLQQRLTTDSTPDLPSWIHLNKDAIPAVLHTLHYWLTTEKSTKQMLAHHIHQNPDALRREQELMVMQTGSAALQRLMDDSVREQRRELEESIRSMSDEMLMDLPFVPPGTSPAEARKLVERNMDSLVDTLQSSYALKGRIKGLEELWYEKTKVCMPPKELRSRHPGFEKAWERVKSESGRMGKATRQALARQVTRSLLTSTSTQDANYNNPKYHPGGDGYPDLKLDAFEAPSFMADFDHRNSPDGAPVDLHTLTWDIASAFFEEVVAALKGLRGRVTVELICGGLSEELAKMRFKGDVTRPPEFPRKYTRMWLSNVPDYTHGPMNMAVYIIPNLQDHEQAAVACNCLLNMGVWEGGDDQYFYTYTHLLPKDIPRFLGCRIIRPQAVMEILVMGAQPLPRPLTELASRDELTTWLTRVLFNTLITGHSRLPPNNVRLPHNLVAFFGLLMHLHRVGFPAHWLSDFLARVLSGRMVSDIAPYDGLWPIPVQDAERRVQSRAFENVIATAYYAIPFALASALPADFSRDPEDIQVYEAKLTATLPFKMNWDMFMGSSSPLEPTSRLLFYRPSVVTPKEVIARMPSIFEGRTSPPPGSFFVLTAQELLQYQTRVRFRLSRRRVERMKSEKWCMLVYRNDDRLPATRPVPVADWIVVGEESP
ncbi:hypothetical protein OH77DRAFT_1502792 [Trametes cingulata]|nr:hypothetical protein OH77DRAFT_1502792 [Trametes cingulata]